MIRILADLLGRRSVLFLIFNYCYYICRKLESTYDMKNNRFPLKAFSLLLTAACAFSCVFCAYSQTQKIKDGKSLLTESKWSKVYTLDELQNQGLTCDIDEAHKTLTISDANPFITKANIPVVVVIGREKYKVTQIGSYAFSKCTKLKEVSIPSSVVSIAYGAFSGCTALEKITIAEGVQTISYEVFNDCSSLPTITLPASVEKIETDVFNGCERLLSINIDPKNKYSTSDNGVLFSKNQTVLIRFPQARRGSYDVPEGVTRIADGAFSDCTLISNVTLPSTLIYIGENAFLKCTSLIGINIPDNVTEIGDFAFYNCTKLPSIDIPASVTAIGYSAFIFCDGLSEINVDNSNKDFTSIDGVLYSKDKKTIIKCPDFRKGNFTIPGSVTTIGKMAFCNCKELTDISIPKSVKTIGEYAFQFCTFTEISLPSGLTQIESYAFRSCENLRQITIPDKVKEIGFGAFELCTALYSVTISNGVAEIGPYAFEQCTSLESITLPKSITEIGVMAFANCTKLRVVTCKSKTPPACEGDNIDIERAPIYNNFDYDTDKLTLYIPKGTADAYSSAPGWSNFEAIVEE